MFSVLAALKSNSIICSFCAYIFLSYIARLARTVRSDLHSSEEAFIDQCIEIVCCMYISRFVQHGKKRFRLRMDEYMCLLRTCKIQARYKRKKRHRKENYLGHVSVGEELCRTSNEFVATVVSAFGYAPVDIN